MFNMTISTLRSPQSKSQNTTNTKPCIPNIYIYESNYMINTITIRMEVLNCKLNLMFINKITRIAGVRSGDKIKG